MVELEKQVHLQKEVGAGVRLSAIRLKRCGVQHGVLHAASAIDRNVKKRSRYRHRCRAMVIACLLVEVVVPWNWFGH